MSRSSTTEKEIENGKQDNGSNPPPDEIGHVWYGQAVQQSWQSAHGNWEASCPVDCLIFKTQLLKRLQCVTVVNGATHTQEDVVQGNGSSLKNEAQISVLFFCGVQLVLGSSVLGSSFTQSLTLLKREMSCWCLPGYLLLSGEGGFAVGRRCCWLDTPLPTIWCVSVFCDAKLHKALEHAKDKWHHCCNIFSSTCFQKTLHCCLFASKKRDKAFRGASYTTLQSIRGTLPPWYNCYKSCQAQAYGRFTFSLFMSSKESER